MALRALEEKDLEMLFDWRNSENVRRFMFSTHLISPAEHLQWFEAIRADPRRHPMIFEHYGVSSGFVNIGPVHAGGVSKWGFYVSPQAPRGIGRLMGASALSHAFATLRLHKVCGEALAGNMASCRFHLSLGFRQEGMLIDEHFDGDAYQDVVRFGLLAAEWQASREVIDAEES